MKKDSNETVAVSPDKPPVALNLDNFLYEAMDVSNFINVNGWSKFYDAIPVILILKMVIDTNPLPGLGSNTVLFQPMMVLINI